MGMLAAAASLFSGATSIATTAIAWCKVNLLVVSAITFAALGGYLAFSYERALSERDAAVTARDAEIRTAKAEISTITEQRDQARRDAADAISKAQAIEADAARAAVITADLEAQKSDLEAKLKLAIPIVIGAPGAGDPVPESFKAALDAIKGSARK